MDLYPDQDQILRRYLLDDVTPEERQLVEDRLLRGDESGLAAEEELDYVDQLLLVEDELIDDYVCEALSTRERELVEKSFFSTSERWQKLKIIQELARLATQYDEETSVEQAQSPAVLGIGQSDDVQARIKGVGNQLRMGSQRTPVWRMLIAPRWKIAVYAMLLIAAWFLIGRRDDKPELSQAMALLDQAYEKQRPLEARVSGFGYAPVSITRGDEDNKPDYSKLDEAEVLLRKAAREKADGRSIYELGKLYLTKKEFDKAITHFEGAMKLGSETAFLYNDLGAALYGKGLAQRLENQSGESETTLARSLEYLSKALDKNDGLPEARFNRALLFESLGLSTQARTDWQKYLEADSNSPWAEEVRRHLKEIEDKEKKRSQREEGLFKDFLGAYQQKDDERLWNVFSRGHLRTGNYIAQLLIDNSLTSTPGLPAISAGSSLEMLEKVGRIAVERTSERCFSDLAAFYRRASLPRRELMKQGRDLVILAYKAQSRSEYHQAAELYARAGTIFEATGAHGEGLFVRYWIGWCYFRQSNMAQCLEVFASLARHSERRGYLWLQALALHGLSYTHEALGDYSKSLDYCQRSRRLSEQIHDGNGTLRSLTRLANLYRLLGQYHQSLHAVRLGLALAAKVLADGSQVIGLHSPAALSFKETGHYYAALEHERENVALCQRLNDLVELSRSCVRMGLIYSKLSRYEDAAEVIEQGIKIGERLEPARVGHEVTHFALLSLGNVYRESGRLAEAISAFDRVIKFFQKSKEHLMLYAAYKGKLLTRIAMNEIGAAQLEMRQLLDELETHRARILEEANRHSFFDMEQGVYDVAIGFTSHKLKDARKAFEYSELCHARSLWDAVHKGKRLVSDGGLYDLRFAGSSKPVDLPTLQREMPEKVRILQYAVLEDRIFIWVIGKRLFEYREINTRIEHLNATIKSFRKKISSPQEASSEAVLVDADELYKLLIATVEPLLEEGGMLCIIPDKMLNLLPFSALFSKRRGRYLLEDHLILYAPSATMFLFCTQSARAKSVTSSERLLSVGNPSFNGKAFPTLLNLSSAEKEAEAITKYYASYRLLTGRQAQESAIKKEMHQSEVIHFALHHLADDSAPLYSKLVLAEPSTHRTDSVDDGVLSAYEVYGLNFERVRLVVLSACQTRADAYYKGEGVVGMSRPFEAAGVPLVVSSLWLVDSEATSELMTQFHAFRNFPGTSTPKALRLAQLKLVHHPNTLRRAPYYWAAFVTVGGHSEF